jgi:ATP-dependent DNA helicase RecQ
LHQPRDEDDLLKKIEYTYPSIETIQKVYQAIAHYYQLAVGSAHLQSFDFDMNEFCTRFKFKQTDVHYSLVRLEQQGILQLSEAYFRAPKLKILVSHEELYSFRLKHPAIDLIVRVLLRKFGGNIYNEYVKVSLADISKYMDTTVQQVKQKIVFLEQHRLIDFIEGGEQPQITYTLPRQDTFKLPINQFWLEERKQKEIEQVHAVIDFLHTQNCRANFIVDYFGQEVTNNCGICDVCVKNKKKNSYDDLTEHAIIEALQLQAIPLEKVSVMFESMDREHVLNTIRLLLDRGIIEINNKMCYQLKLKK